MPAPGAQQVPPGAARSEGEVWTSTARTQWSSAVRFVAPMNADQAAVPIVSVPPSRSFESRTGTTPGTFVASSTQLP